MQLRASLAFPNHDTSLEVKEELLWWQEKGLQFTASGYGRKIPTSYKVKHNNRWKRVYCCCFSNVGTLYITTKDSKEWIVVDIWRD